MRWIALLLMVCPSLLSAFSFNTGERVQLHRHREFDPSKETERHKIIGENMPIERLCNFWVIFHIFFIHYQEYVRKNDSWIQHVALQIST